MKISRRNFLILAGSGMVSAALVPSNQGYKSVLIIGDSISLGFFPFLNFSELPVCLIQPTTSAGLPINCGSTKKGIENLDHWLGSTDWDLVYFNFGLHDLKHVKSNSGKASKSPLDSVNVSLEDYRINLGVIADTLARKSKVVVFGTTTPVPKKLKGGPYRNSESPTLYNEVALEVMKSKGVDICDLYSYIVGKPWLQLDANVHFSKKGYQLLAKKVQDCIIGYLK